jgi:hypothetical protein
VTRETPKRKSLVKQPNAEERGSALVLILGSLLVFSALAIIAVSIVTSDKRSAATEYTHNKAFYSADAATEAGLNWLLMQPTPPPLLDADSNVRLAGAPTGLGAGHEYSFGVQYVTKRFRAGWTLDYRDYEFNVEADGASARQAAASVDLVATRLYREGY